MATKINHAHTREKIMRVARHLFATRGFDATSMEDIAGKVGIKKPSLYYFFRDKEEIFEKVMDDIFERLDCDLAAIVAAGMKPEAHFRAVIVRSINAGREGSMAVSAHYGSRSGSMHTAFKKRTDALKERLAIFFKKNSVRQPGLAAEVVFNAIQSYIFHAQSGPPPVSPEAYAEYLGSILLPKKTK